MINQTEEKIKVKVEILNSDFLRYKESSNYQINTIEGSLGEYARTSDFDNYATKDDLSEQVQSLVARINQMPKQRDSTEDHIMLSNYANSSDLEDLRRELQIKISQVTKSINENESK